MPNKETVKNYKAILINNLSTIGVLGIGIVLSFVLFIQFHHAAFRQVKTEFMRYSDEKINLINDMVWERILILQSVKSFFNASQYVERDEFAICVEPYIKNNMSIRAIEWLPLVKHDEREMYEAKARSDGLEKYQFTEYDSSGQLVRAKQRQEYYPVFYTEPYKGNENDIGFDKASEEIRKTAMINARNTGEPVATAPICLVQGEQGQTGMVIFIPIYRKGTIDYLAERRVESIAGFVCGVFDISDMINSRSNTIHDKYVDVKILDITNGLDKQQVYPSEKADSENARFNLTSEKIIEVAKRKWLVQCRPSPSFAVSRYYASAWIILVIGILVSIYIYRRVINSAQRTRMIQSLVDERTAELARTVDELNSQVRHREEVELQLISLNADLKLMIRRMKTANKELQHLTHVTSHDLQEPLRKICCLGRLLSENASSKLNADDNENLVFMIEGADQMLKRIESVGNYARLISDPMKLTRVDLNELFNRFINYDYAEDIKIAGAKVEFSGKMLPVTGNGRHLEFVISQLFANAIKYKRPNTEFKNSNKLKHY